MKHIILLTITFTLLLLTEQSEARKQIKVCNSMISPEATLFICRGLKINAGLNELKKFENLKKLRFEGRSTQKNFSDRSIKKLITFKNITESVEELRFEKINNVSAKGWNMILTHFKNLKKLSFVYSKVGNEVIPSVKGLKSLETLEFQKTKVTCSGIKPLSGNTKLKELIMSYNDGCNDSHAPLFSSMVNLKKLSLNGTDFTKEGVAAITDEIDVRVRR